MGAVKSTMSLLKSCAKSTVEVEGNREGSVRRFSEAGASASEDCDVFCLDPHVRSFLPPESDS